MSGDVILSVEGLTRRFGDFVAVDDLGFEVRRGSIFAFLGANGSGKSTSIRMMIGLLTPTAGAIRVDGVDVIRQPRRVRDRIGYMGQKVSLYQGLTLRDNVEFYAGLHGLSDRVRDERWATLRERFELGDAERELPENMAAGIRQRAGLALATLHRPRVLFLDEPTAGVDVHSRGVFWDMIQDESDAGTTVFVTTHFLEEVDFCDRVCFIDQGRLVANDSPAALRRRFGGGSRIRVAIEGADEATHACVRASLASEGFATEDTADGALVAKVAELDDARLAALARALDRHAGAEAKIELPEMTDVFRRLLRDAASTRR